MNKISQRIVLAIILVVAYTEPAFATTSAGGLPWEGPLAAIAKSLTGPVALSLSIVALFVAGGTLIFGGELGEFAKRICMLALVIALLVAGAGFITLLFGVSAATIAQAATLQLVIA